MFTFGAPTQTSSSGGFTFGTPATTSTGFGAFGATQATNTPSKLFGTTTTSAPSYGAFGTVSTSSGSVFGTSFGAKPTGFGGGIGSSVPALKGGLGSTAPTLSGGLGSGFGGVGSGTLGTSTFGQQSTTGFSQPSHGILSQAFQSGSTTHQVAPLALLTAALSRPQIYGDERDGIIAKLNHLQAYWGTGKGFYNQQGVVDFTPQNPFCRFKVVGYSRIPTASNEDGHLSLEINKKESLVREQQQGLVDALHKCLGSKPTLIVCIEGIKPLPEDRSEVVMYVVERHQNGSSRTIPASDVFTHMNQTNIKSQLQVIGIVNLVTKTGMSPAQLQQYLDNPPAGMDPLLWEQAKKDNTDPQRLIPVPMIGFSELKKRLKLQEQETLQHQKRLSLIGEEIADLQHNHATTMAKLAQFKRKHLELSHRVLEVMVKQESLRKSGYSVQADEEQLRVQLECLQAELNAPSQFKARLNELMSQIRLQQSQGGERLGTSDGRYVVDGVMQLQLQQHLARQQVGLMHLIGIIKDDLQDLGTIERGLTEQPTARS